MKPPGDPLPHADADNVQTYCRVCEASCGLVATRVNGRLVSVAGDPQHAFSQGHFCKKAMGAVEVAYDPERVVQPLRRTGRPGEFTPVSWEEALEAIASRLQAIRAAHGPEAFATFLGQPPTNSYATAIWFGAFKQVMQTKWNYCVNAEDAAAYSKASEILFGSVAMGPKPDLWRTDFAIIIGANPLVSHGSVCCEPMFRKCLNEVVARGGRVVVIDPRRSETAQGYEHVSVNAGTDPWFLLAMLNVILGEGLADLTFLAEHATGLEELKRSVRPFTPDVSAERCGVDANTIRELARDFATAPRAVVYGRTGTCTQRFGTLTNLLQDLLCVVTGNLDRAGGLVFPRSTFAPQRNVARGHQSPPLLSRTTGLPEVAGMMPSRALISDITTPGDERVRAVMMLGANPVHSSGAAGPGYAEALEALELHFSLDIYVNETNRHADYILPVTTMFEHEDVPYKYLGNKLRPMLWATAPVIEPRGEARDEWWIMNEICRRLGLGGAYLDPEHRRLSGDGVLTRPQELIDALLAASDFGRDKGLSFEALIRDHGRGLILEAQLPVGQLPTEVFPIPLAPPELVGEVERVAAYSRPHDFPFLLIGMREVLSQNTWMHNVPSLMPDSRRHALHIHPDDAASLGVAGGQRVRVRSADGEIATTVELSRRMKPGNVALPHGWGHSGGWTRANNSGGVNSNLLAHSGLGDVEALAGMSILNGIPVSVEAG